MAEARLEEDYAAKGRDQRIGNSGDYLGKIPGTDVIHPKEKNHADNGGGPALGEASTENGAETSATEGVAEPQLP